MNMVLYTIFVIFAGWMASRLWGGRHGAIVVISLRGASFL